ncbi:MAG: 3-isopropylmalate dehydrogenase, partial [Anaerolineae bacterium]|nr:3-isopropylmalate dehydrogenase [Anaerolineae bacterium]
WGFSDLADKVDNAVKATLEEGSHTADILPERALSTTAFTDRIIAHLAS